MLFSPAVRIQRGALYLLTVLQSLAAHTVSGTQVLYAHLFKGQSSEGRWICKKWKVRSGPEDTEARQETEYSSKGGAQASFACVCTVLVQPPD